MHRRVASNWRGGKPASVSDPRAGRRYEFYGGSNSLRDLQLSFCSVKHLAGCDALTTNPLGVPKPPPKIDATRKFFVGSAQKTLPGHRGRPGGQRQCASETRTARLLRYGLAGHREQRGCGSTKPPTISCCASDPAMCPASYQNGATLAAKMLTPGAFPPGWEKPSQEQPVSELRTHSENCGGLLHRHHHLP